mgnify:CR=1 FL=1
MSKFIDYEEMIEMLTSLFKIDFDYSSVFYDISQPNLINEYIIFEWLVTLVFFVTLKSVSPERIIWF